MKVHTYNLVRMVSVFIRYTVEQMGKIFRFRANSELTKGWISGICLLVEMGGSNREKLRRSKTGIFEREHFQHCSAQYEVWPRRKYFTTSWSFRRQQYRCVFDRENFWRCSGSKGCGSMQQDRWQTWNSSSRGAAGSSSKFRRNKMIRPTLNKLGNNTSKYFDYFTTNNVK